MNGFGAGAELQSRAIQGLGSQHIDGGADAARGDIGSGGFVDLNARDALGGDVTEVEGATQTTVGWHLAPFSVTKLKSAPNPRTVTVAPSPRWRSIATPVMR